MRPQENPDAAEHIRAQYDPVTAERRLLRDATRPLIGPAYDPVRAMGRRPMTQAIRPLSQRKALALYLYQMLVLIVVIGAFIALVANPVAILPSTN